MRNKHKILFVMCLLAALLSFSSCEDIKFIEKVSGTTASNGDTSSSDNITDDKDSWKTQTLISSYSDFAPTSTSTENHYPATVTSVPTETTRPPITVDFETMNTSEDTVTSQYFVETDPQPIRFVKSTKLYESSTDTAPFKLKAGRTATLVGYSIDKKWDVIVFADDTFLILSDLDSYEIVEETETTTTVTTTPTETTTTEVPTTTTTVVTTTPTTTAPTVTTASVTTPPITTAAPATTTTAPPATTTVTTTTTQLTTRPLITSQAPSATTSGKKVTGNVGGIEFPSDVSKTSLVFGITFVNMDLQIYLVNDVDVSSGPGVPNKSNGYINLGMYEAGTEMKCLGISYDGWLRVRLPNKKIGFIYETDASAL